MPRTYDNGYLFLAYVPFTNLHEKINFRALMEVHILKGGQPIWVKRMNRNSLDFGRRFLSENEKNSLTFLHRTFFKHIKKTKNRKNARLHRRFLALITQK